MFTSTDCAPIELPSADEFHTDRTPDERASLTDDTRAEYATELAEHLECIRVLNRNPRFNAHKLAWHKIEVRELLDALANSIR